MPTTAGARAIPYRGAAGGRWGATGRPPVDVRGGLRTTARQPARPTTASERARAPRSDSEYAGSGLRAQVPIRASAAATRTSPYAATELPTAGVGSAGRKLSAHEQVRWPPLGRTDGR